MGDDKASGYVAEDKPRVGRVLGDARKTTLRNMPPPGVDGSAGFAENHPICPFCKAPARPAILMFGDSGFRDVVSQGMRWDDWSYAVKRVCKESLIEKTGDAAKPLRVVVLEIGAGGNVTTVRNTSEKRLREFRRSGADVRLIRINPDYPLGDEEEFAPNGESASQVLSIMSRGLAALEKIDAAMPT